MKVWILLCTILIFVQGCFSHKAVLTPGVWRLTIKSEVVDIPALIEVQDPQNIFLLHGEEKYKLERLSGQSDNEIRLAMHIFDSELVLTKFAEDEVSGSWIRNDKNPVQVYKVSLQRGKTTLFDLPKEKPNSDLSGNWRWIFDVGTENDSTVVGIFKQSGSKISGSLASNTGDYGLIEGEVFNNQVKMAAFDGVFAFVITGTMDGDTLKGEFYSTSGVKKFMAVKDPGAKLLDPTTLTQAIKGQKFDFNLPSVYGQSVSLSDVRYKNKPVVLQIYGSWCPNCLDEVKFLSQWYRENKSLGVEILALSFERTTSINKAKANVKRSIDRFNIEYDFLIAGFDGSVKPEEVLPIKNFISFPTTIFLNKKHEEVKIHAGFSGPATGEEYTKFIKFFNQSINELILN